MSSDLIASSAVSAPYSEASQEADQGDVRSLSNPHSPGGAGGGSGDGASSAYPMPFAEVVQEAEQAAIRPLFGVALPQPALSGSWVILLDGRIDGEGSPSSHFGLDNGLWDGIRFVTARRWKDHEGGSKFLRTRLIASRVGELRNKITLYLVFLVCTLLVAWNVRAEGFLTSPLRCGNTAVPCTFPYNQGPYTPGILNSVMDHSLVKNPNGFWPYKVLNSTLGSDGIVVAFNGERAVGTRKIDDPTCIYGRLWLKPSVNAPKNTALVNGSGCGANYASYDEHPGYDYRASSGTEVRAAAHGTVVTGQCIPNGIQSCADWGYVGINHGNGYITQYGHLSTVFVKANETVAEGQIIGLVGHKGLPSGDHLHFEVLRLLQPDADPTRANTVVVDPYGWAGTGDDPLVNGDQADPRYQQNGIENDRLWADRCDLRNISDPIPAGFGASYKVFSTYKEVLLRATCNNTGVTFKIGSSSPSEFIYRYGYEWRNNQWHLITFSGPTRNGDWLIGEAQVRRPRTPAELKVASPFLAYICESINNEWKCGCRDETCTTSFWQVQYFQQDYVKLWN